MGAIRTTTRQVELTVSHPGGSVRLCAPDDVPLEQLMGDLLDCTGQGDGDWILSGKEGGEYPGWRTLEQLKVRDGTRLRLSERISQPASALAEPRSAGPEAEAQAAAAPAVGVKEPAGRVEERVAGRVTLIEKPTSGEPVAGREAPAVGVEDRVEKPAVLANRRSATGRGRRDATLVDAELVDRRPLRDRTDRVLPARLSPAARCRVMVDSLGGRARHETTAGGGSAVAHDPATFTRTVRVSPLERCEGGVARDRL